MLRSYEHNRRQALSRFWWPGTPSGRRNEHDIGSAERRPTKRAERDGDSRLPAEL
jgi:hypothetical protein